MYKTTDNPHHYIVSRFWKHWTVSLVAFLVLAYVMIQVPYFAVPNLITIEFAPDAEALYLLLTNTQHPVPSTLYPTSSTLHPTPCTLLANTYLDFAFMLAYTALFYFSGRVVYDLLQFHTRKLLFILFLPLFFDVIENLLLLQMLGKAPKDYFSFGTFYYAVRLKWFFAVPGTIVTLLVLFYHLYAGLDRVYARSR